MKSSSPETREKIKQAQLAWIKYRDTNIALMNQLGKESGSYGNIVGADYKSKLVEKRVLELKYIFASPEDPTVEW